MSNQEVFETISDSIKLANRALFVLVQLIDLYEFQEDRPKLTGKKTPGNANNDTWISDYEDIMTRIGIAADYVGTLSSSLKKLDPESD